MSRARTLSREILDDASEWMVLLEDPTASDADRQRFEDWQSADPRHADAFDRVVTYREAIRLLPSTAIEERFRRRSRREKIVGLLRGSGARALIPAVLAVAALGFFVPQLTPDPSPAAVEAPVSVVSHTSERGETREVTLDDGSLVILGALSRIEVSYSNTQRRIDLVQGELFVEVVPDADRPLSVTSGLMVATAVGTAFEVSESGGTRRVSVSEGTVDVAHPLMVGGRTGGLNKHETLSVGQTISATERDGLSAPTTISLSSIGAWRTGRLVYAGESLQEIVGDINRYSSAPVDLAPGLEGKQLSGIRGAFRGDDIDQLLRTLPELLPITIDRSDASRIVLKPQDPDETAQ